MLKFGFEQLLYISKEYSHVRKMLSKFCYGLYIYICNSVIQTLWFLNHTDKASIEV